MVVAIDGRLGSLFACHTRDHGSDDLTALLLAAPQVFAQPRGQPRLAIDRTAPAAHRAVITSGRAG